MTDKIYIALVGENPGTTVIRWNGPAGADMLYLNGARYSRWERITWDGAGSAGTAVRHLWTGSSGAATALNHIDEIFKDVQYGIRAGDGANHMDAEATVVRSKFYRCSQAGVSIESWNALDWWIRESEFVGNRRGVTNLNNAGNFHVYNSIFRNSTEADVAVTHNLFFSLRDNISINSKKFLTGGNIGRNNENLTLQRNRIITPVDSDAIVVENLGPLLLLDNQFQSRPGAVGPVVRHSTSYSDTETIAIGNTFTVNNPISTSSGRPQQIDTVVNSALSLSERPLPGAAPNYGRKVFEVGAGSNAWAIQQVINSAAAAGSRAVVHIPSGTYNIDTTLSVPANSDIQIVGDSMATTLQWIGAAGGRVFQLNGPSRATLKYFRILGQGNGDGIWVQGADQPGARVLTRQMHINAASGNSVLAENLNYARVIMQDLLFYYTGSQSSVKGHRRRRRRRPSRDARLPRQRPARDGHALRSRQRRQDVGGRRLDGRFHAADDPAELDRLAHLLRRPLLRLGFDR